MLYAVLKWQRHTIHLSNTADSFAGSISTAGHKTGHAHNIKTHSVGSSSEDQLVFLRKEQRVIFYRAACLSICVAGMTSASLCWDRKILSHYHCHKSNTIMKWHHSGPVIKWAHCCLGLFTRLGDCEHSTQDNCSPEATGLLSVKFTHLFEFLFLPIVPCIKYIHTHSTHIS